MQVELTLPLPPSANAIWRKKRLSQEAKNYYLTVKSLIATKRAKGTLQKETITCDVAVEVTVMLGKRNKRDLDNCAKALFDALTKAGVWADDKQVKKISMQFGEVLDKGLIHIKIEPVASVV